MLVGVIFCLAFARLKKPQLPESSNIGLLSSLFHPPASLLGVGMAETASCPLTFVA